MSMLPTAGLGGKVNTADIDMDEAERNLKKTEAIILSMTSAERSKPELLNPSRKNRIARGAGVDIADVNRLVKSFDQMKKMMKQMPGMMKQFGGKKGKFKLPF
jgi:signal recognition particle subunit SRP54